MVSISTAVLLLGFGFLLGAFTTTAILWGKLRLGQRLIIHFNVYVERNSVPTEGDIR